MLRMHVFFLGALLIVTDCDSIFSPVPNPNNCINQPEICISDTSQLLVCDSDSGRCKRPDGRCANIAQCPTAATPVCLNQSCVSCTMDQECAAWSALWGKSLPYCVAMSCQACGKSADCSQDPLKPACDSVTHTCRRCMRGDECPSQVCRTDSTIAPDSGVQIGQCVPESALTYVDNRDTATCVTDGSFPNAGSSTRPFCEIAPALAAHHSSLRIAGSDKGYAAFAVTGMSVIVLGPGRDARPTAVIAGLSVQEDSVQHTAGSLSLIGAQLGAATGSPPLPTVKDAATCGNNATLILRNVALHSSSRGVNTSPRCTALTVEQTFINAAGYAIAVGSAGGAVTSYRLINNIVRSSGGLGGSELYAILLGDGSSGYCAFNTLKDNLNGIRCDGLHHISDTIVASSRMQVEFTAGCDVARIADQVDFDPSSQEVPWLLPGSPLNLMNVIDHTSVQEAQSDASAVSQMPISLDYFGTARSLGQKLDIGAQEGQ